MKTCESRRHPLTSRKHLRKTVLCVQKTSTMHHLKKHPQCEYMIPHSIEQIETIELQCRHVMFRVAYAMWIIQLRCTDYSRTSLWFFFYVLRLFPAFTSYASHLNSHLQLEKFAQAASRINLLHCCSAA